MHLKEDRFSLAGQSLKYQLLLSVLHAQLIISFLLRLSGAGGIDSLRAQRQSWEVSHCPPQTHTVTAGTRTEHSRKHLDLLVHRITE